VSDTDALYQEIILEHNRKPRNFREMPNADRTKLTDDTISDISFRGQGCAISKASASLMTTAVKGKSRGEAEAIFQRFHSLVTGKMPEVEHATMGSLRALGGVSKFPLRVKCASLAWHALHSALDAGAVDVSTQHLGPEVSPGEGA
jgi:nitrogen fixation NifU-like protein